MHTAATGAAALSCFPQAGRQRVPYVLHGQNDLIARNGTTYAAQRQLRRSKGLGHSAYIAVDAGNLHQPADRVAYQTERIFWVSMPIHFTICKRDCTVEVT